MLMRDSDPREQSDQMSITASIPRDGGGVNVWRGLHELREELRDPPVFASTPGSVWSRFHSFPKRETPIIPKIEQGVSHQPAKIFSISCQHHFNRAGGRTSNVLQENEEEAPSDTGWLVALGDSPRGTTCIDSSNWRVRIGISEELVRHEYPRPSISYYTVLHRMVGVYYLRS